MNKPNNNSKFVNTLLDGAHLVDFEQIKSYHGIKTNSDVVRFLIRQEARRLAAPLAPSAIGDLVGAFLAGHTPADEPTQAIAENESQP